MIKRPAACKRNVGDRTFVNMQGLSVAATIGKIEHYEGIPVFYLIVDGLKGGYVQTTNLDD